MQTMLSWILKQDFLISRFDPQHLKQDLVANDITLLRSIYKFVSETFHQRSIQLYQDQSVSTQAMAATYRIGSALTIFLARDPWNDELVRQNLKQLLSKGTARLANRREVWDQLAMDFRTPATDLHHELSKYFSAEDIIERSNAKIEDIPAKPVAMAAPPVASKSAVNAKTPPAQNIYGEIQVVLITNYGTTSTHDFTDVESAWEFAHNRIINISYDDMFYAEARVFVINNGGKTLLIRATKEGGRLKYWPVLWSPPI